MKRRLNILCLIVMLVLSYSVLEAGYYFFVGAKLGAEAGMEIEEKGAAASADYQQLLNVRLIGLVPNAYSRAATKLFCDSIYNEKSGEYVPMSYSSVAISIDTHTPIWKRVLSYLLIYLHFGVTVWAIVLFVRLIISINKSDIFNWRNVRRLRRLGIALIVSFCCVTGGAYLDLVDVREVFSVSGYELSLSEMMSITNLVLGLCSLIVGEVFAIGLKMKEEQDLTI